VNKLCLAAISSAFILTGCATTTPQMDALNNKVDKLSEQISSLQASQTQLKNKLNQSSDLISSAQDEAQRANERIDNIAQSYTK